MDAEGSAEAVVNLMTAACDASMPRQRAVRRRAAYWWTGEIAALRRASVRSRHALQHARPRRGDPAEIEERYRAYSEARGALKKAIGASKTRAWAELTATLDRDPWGRPYKIVLKKMKGGLPLSQSASTPRYWKRSSVLCFLPGMSA